MHQVIDPWNVSGGADGKIDYNKLLAQVCRQASVVGSHAG